VPVVPVELNDEVTAANERIDAEFAGQNHLRLEFNSDLRKKCVARYLKAVRSQPLLAGIQLKKPRAVCWV